MNILSLVLYTIIGVSFITVLLTRLSTDRAQRRRFMFISFAPWLILIGLFLIFAISPQKHLRPDDLPSEFVLHMIGFGSIWPQLIAYVVNQWRMKNPIIQLNISITNFVTGLIGIGFLLLLTTLSLLPNKISVADGTPIYDAEYFRSRISFLLVLIPAMLFYFLIAIERRTICSNGVLYNGLFWGWSEFRGYSWSSHPKRNDRKKLTLTIHKPWIISRIELEMFLETQAQLEPLLTQKLKQPNQ